MTHLRVDVAALGALAATIRHAAAEADAAANHRGLVGPSAALADERLVEAMLRFVDRWGHALRALIDDARRLADGLDLVSAFYTDAETAARSSFASVALDRWSSPGGGERP